MWPLTYSNERTVTQGHKPSLSKRMGILWGRRRQWTQLFFFFFLFSFKMHIQYTDGNTGRQKQNWVCTILMNLVLCGCCFSSNPASCLCVWFVCVSVHLHNTEIFQCFLSAREVARSRDRERASSSTGLGSGSVSRSGGGGGGEDDTILSQEGRRGSTGLPEGQDLYTAACNSVIHRCALLLLGVSPVLGELTKQNQEEGQTQSATGTQECLSFMTRSERCTAPYSLIKQHETVLTD